MGNNSSNLSIQLQGDWTIGGVVQQLSQLQELSVTIHDAPPAISVDCHGIESIDMCGFQLLEVWLHCQQIKGHKTTVINMPDFMRESRQRLGIPRSCYPRETSS